MEGREIPVLMKTSHTTLSASSSSSSSSHVHSEKDQADGWSCVSVMAAGMVLTEGLHTSPEEEYNKEYLRRLRAIRRLYSHRLQSNRETGLPTLTSLPFTYFMHIHSSTVLSIFPSSFLSPFTSFLCVIWLSVGAE